MSAGRGGKVNVTRENDDLLRINHVEDDGRLFQPMTDTASTLLQQVLELPEHDRAEIANRLLESLEKEIDKDVDEVWAGDIERRCAALDSGEAVTSDWSDFRARIEREVFGR